MIAHKLRQALQGRAAASPELLAGDTGHDAGDPNIVPAAVLVPIVDRPEPGVILTLRTNNVRRHAGQIAFPGGRIDPEDSGAVEASLREAEEEIGLSRDQVEIIGIADPYHTITGYHVTPVISVVPPDLPLVPQPAEVAAIFETPLSYLLDPANQIARTVDWHGTPRTYYEIQWEDRRIWGATAAMIINLSRRLDLRP